LITECKNEDVIFPKEIENVTKIVTKNTIGKMLFNFTKMTRVLGK